MSRSHARSQSPAVCPGLRHLGILAGLCFLASCDAEDLVPASIEGARRPQAVLEAGARVQREAHARLVAPPAAAAAGPAKQILFGDLHVHTSYSWDGFLFSLPLVGGEGAHPPADACDFARHCAALDFFALTDHAESALASHWEASKQSVRQCDALAGDPASPDLVAFMGFEWSQAGLTPETHFGHRCVVFPGTADDQLPARPISSGDKRSLLAEMSAMIGKVRWIQPWDWGAYTSYVDYLDALTARPVCQEGVDTRLLPADCEELAPTPAVLREKLDQWGLDALTIPHGTAWGTYTPATASIAKHLSPRHFDPERQLLVEIMSGHGNAERYLGWREFDVDEAGRHSCPEPTRDYLPCCWQAGEIMRSRCGDLPAAECEERVVQARRYALESYLRPEQVFPDAEPEEWLDCGQCRGCFKPAYGYRPKESVQYAMALARPEESRPGASPLRFRYGFVASSDGHTARPGTGYKQIERSMMTDAVGSPGFLFEQISRLSQRMEDPRQPQLLTPGPIGIMGSDMRTTSFLYAGGLAAVHAEGRSREAIWRAFARREVYGTSGPRILLWFDLLRLRAARVPMGSEVALGENPRFEVRAVGSFEQLPGCPDWSREGLSPERLERLCRGECFHPGRRRRAIVAVEVIRIRPQLDPGEAVEPLIEDPWRRFECPSDPEGCAVRFEDPEFVSSGRDALYYVRVLEESSLALNGAPLSTEFDEAAGDALRTRLCRGPGSEDGCLAPVQERAWSSPIFVNQLR